MPSRRSALLSIAAAPFAAAADWPQFLGPTRNGIYPDPLDVSLKNPHLLWKKGVGEGFSSPVVVKNQLILFHRVGDKERVECMEAATGKSLWLFEYGTNYRDDFGFDEGPRGTPTVSGERIFTFGAEGVLHAIDLKSGRALWRVDTHQKFGVRKGFFGAAASPLVDDRAVYVNVGGPKGAGLVAFDKSSGKVLWTATDDDAGYSSPIAAVVDGVRTILCFTREGLAAVEPDTGKVRFHFRWRSRSNASVNAAVPVVDGNRIFLSASYNTGAVLLEVSGTQIKKLWSSDDVLSNHYASNVYKDGFLYGFHGRQEFGQSFRCVEMSTGKVQWSVDDFGAGTVTLLGKSCSSCARADKRSSRKPVRKRTRPKGRRNCCPVSSDPTLPSQKAVFSCATKQLWQPTRSRPKHPGRARSRSEPGMPTLL